MNPPRGPQNALLRMSSSRKKMRALPLRSSLLMREATSTPLDFSARFAKGPLNTYTSSPRSNMNTSPLFRDLLDRGTGDTLTVRAPFKCSNRGSYTSLTTFLNPDCTPPGRYSMPPPVLNRARNSGDSDPWTSRN